MSIHNHIPLSRRLAAIALVAGVGLAGCSSSSPSSNGSSSKTTAASDGTGQVLPVTTNPIKNTSTVKALEISSILVENNVDPKTKKTTDDHLEVALKNTGNSALTNAEVFYTFTDTKTNDTENYYLKLPSSFTIPANNTRIAHFDNTGAVDHFPVSDFSLYKTSTNALDVTVTVSAKDSAVQTTTIKKDAGGAEVAGA